jgi:hypothetical protein
VVSRLSKRSLQSKLLNYECVSACGVFRVGTEWDKGCIEKFRDAQNVKLHLNPKDVAAVVLYESSGI